MAQISRLDDCAMNNMVYIATSIASICVSEVASIVTLSMSHIPIPSRRERFSPATFYNKNVNTCARFVHTVYYTMSGIKCTY